MAGGMALQSSQELEQDSFRGICKCIAEFLQYEHLDGSLEAFTIETASTFTTRRGLRNRQHVTSEQTYMLLLRHFDQGDCKSFFSQWHSKVLDPRIADNLHKLEFWLQLYFAVYPVLIGHLDDSSLSHTLPAFKQYLDTHGPLLANDPQLLSYYALPYVRSPQSHPAFAHIFTPTFVTDLRSQLSNVLCSAPEAPVPRLYSMYAAAQAIKLLPASAAVQSDVISAQPGTSSKRSAPRHVDSGPISRAVHCNSRAAGQGLTGNSRPPSGAAGRELTGNKRPLSGVAVKELTRNSRPISGITQAVSRPISALLNGSRELADLVSVSKPRYADQLTAPSLEASAEILHVVHSEGIEHGLSAEVSLQETEHSLADPGFQTLAMHRAAVSSDMTAAPEDASQASNEALSQSFQLHGHSQRGTEHPISLPDAALEGAGHVTPLNDSSSAELVQGDSAATALAEGISGSQKGRPLELLAASRTRQSAPASTTGSASLASSLAPSAKDSLNSCQALQQALPVESSAGGSAELRPDGAGKVAVERQSPDGLVASYASSDAEASPVGTAGGTQSSTTEVGLLYGREISGLAEDNTALSEPMSGNSGVQHAAVTASATSSTAGADCPSDHAELSHNGEAAAADACITTAAHGHAGETSVAANPLADACNENTAVRNGDQAAEEQTRTSTRSSASSTGRDGRQTAKDAPASQRPLSSSSRSSGRNTAAAAVAGLDAALHLDRSTVLAQAVTASAGTRESRISSSSETTQAFAAGDAAEQLSRSSTDKAAGTDKPGRSIMLPRRSITSAVSVSSHAQPERSQSPELPAALTASFKSGDTSAKVGQTSTGTGSGRASSLMGASLSTTEAQGESLTGASPVRRSTKAVDSMGTSLKQLAANTVNTSLSQLGKQGGAGVIRHSVILTGLDPLDQWLYRQPGVLASLDYDKVKTDLQGGEAGLAAALLQSLRWRLDKAATASDRCQTLASYIENDLLMLRQANADMSWSGNCSSSGSKAPSSGVSEQWARLFGAFADSQAGRAYLCTALTPVLHHLCHCWQPEANTSDSREAHSGGLSGHALEALQKLSLRRETRPVMAGQGVLRWLAHQLSHIDSLPLLSLECCGALLMNLAMAKAGRQECHQLGMVVPLESLLEHDSMRVQTYANATLYSLVREPDFRHSAHEKGLDDLLRHVQANARPVIGRQIECVLKHWQDLELGKAVREAGEDGLGDQQDDDPQDAHTGVTDGMDEAESIHSWDQLHGERLLASRYLQDQPSGIQSSQQIPLHTSVSIQDMGAMPSPALSQNSTAAASQVFALDKQRSQQSAMMPAVNRLNRSGNALLPAKLPKLIPAAKQEEYFAAFGSQTKLPRTPLLPGY